MTTYGKGWPLTLASWHLLLAKRTLKPEELDYTLYTAALGDRTTKNEAFHTLLYLDTVIADLTLHTSLRRILITPVRTVLYIDVLYIHMTSVWCMEGIG
jgi:hypothetical protein